MMRLLVINPGSTSTKLAVYDEQTEVFRKSIDHSHDQAILSSDFAAQVPLRLTLVREALEENDIPLETLTAVVGRGGILHPLPGGVYEINASMRRDLVETRYGDHASGIGSVIAYDIAHELDIPALTVDPVVVDELEWPARYTGLPEIRRISIFHALNQKAVARRYAASIGKRYDELNLIVAHMGGGISIGAHQKGRVIDVANAFDGEGPFSAERAGSLPVGSLISMCFSGRYASETELRRHLIGKGGLYAYLGTKDAREIDQRIAAGDEEARRVLYAMTYQIKKEIGSLYTVLEGELDAILLTGGMAYDPYVVEWLKEGLSYLAEIVVYPGENELESLRDGALAALSGKEPIQEYEA
ncbi:MAG TPA: butyrate kinase [Fastidiosipila sp.]|jgi:butyrate kinase|nr:butyrate kinase [Fastidiosipila sp.]